MSKGKGLGAYGTLAIGVVAIAWSAIFVRWTVMPGIASAFYRMFIGVVVLWPMLLLSGVKLKGVSRGAWMLAALGGVFFAGDVGLFNTAVMHTSAGSATFLANNAPLLVGLMTWAITRKIPAWRFWVALAIASTGAWLIVSVDAGHAASAADLLAVGSSVCFAMYLMTTERMRKEMDTRVLVTISATASAAALLGFALLTHASLAIPSARSLAAVLGLGLVCQVLGYFCLTYALGHLPATVTSVVLLTVAPLTAVFAFGIFGERMTLAQIAGGLFVIAGVWVVSRTAKIEARDYEPFSAIG